MYYVVLDAVKESQSHTHCLGIFTDETVAGAVCTEAEQRYRPLHRDDWWSREFIVVAVDALDVAKRLDYTSDDPWGDNPFRSS